MKKIMFDDRYGLTRAVLEGRKTMTRRLVPHGTPLGNWEDTVKKSRYQVGEVVAVAQSYKKLNEDGFVPPEWLDHTCESSAGYNNKMFVRADLMPERNLIRITNIRVERLQDISEENCMKEGILRFTCNLYEYRGVCYSFDGDTSKVGAFKTPHAAFAALIDKVSGNGTWGSNPWVFVYEFELVK